VKTRGKEFDFLSTTPNGVELHPI